MIKFWSKFHFQILWCNFIGDNRFLLTPSLISPRNILPPAPLKTSTTTLIFSTILNSIMEKWKYRYRELLNPKKNQKTIRNKTFSWNLHEIFFKHFHEMSQSSGQNQQNGKQTYCQLPSPLPLHNLFCIFFSAEREEDYGVEKMTKIKLATVLITSFNKFHLFRMKVL